MRRREGSTNSSATKEKEKIERVGARTGGGTPNYLATRNSCSTRSLQEEPNINNYILREQEKKGKNRSKA